MMFLENLSKAWATRLALHALPYFSGPNTSIIILQRRNTLWNWGFLIIQIVALASYDVLELCSIRRVGCGLAFAIGFYGWVDLTLCIIRKTFLMHLRMSDVGNEWGDVERIVSAWLMFVSATVVYANLFYVIGRVEGQFDKSVSGVVAAFAFSASTITTVGYGYYSPIGIAPVILAFFEAMSGIALISCVISAAISRALSPTGGSLGVVEGHDGIDSVAWPTPWCAATVILASGYIIGYWLTGF